MNWFLAKLVFRIKTGDGKHAAQFEEQLRLVTAKDAQQALHKAKKLGEQEETTFYNIASELVSWTFLGVVELVAVGEPTDGMECSSRIEETDDAEFYIDRVIQKGRDVKIRVDVMQEIF